MGKGGWNALGDWDWHIYAMCTCSHSWPTAAHQARLSMGSSQQEYWSGWPCSPPGDLSDIRIEPASPASLHCRWILCH